MPSKVLDVYARVRFIRTTITAMTIMPTLESTASIVIMVKVIVAMMDTCYAEHSFLHNTNSKRSQISFTHIYRLHADLHTLYALRNGHISKTRFCTVCLQYAV